MVTWNGSTYQYHDKAYIWNGSEFELVWEKLGLKLLYETQLALKPVSSENNRYLYFTEGSDDSIIYRLIINAREPEPEEWYTSNTYTVFTAPRSSRGVGMHRTAQQYANSPFDYRMLNLETGGYGGSGTFDFVAQTGVSFVDRYGAPILNGETVSQAIDLSYKYASQWGGALINVWYNFLYFIAISGVSAQLLSNSEHSGSYISGGNGIWDMGRLENDPTARGLFPRFLMLTNTGDFQVLEYQNGNKYTAEITSTPPFTLTHTYKYGVGRDGKLAVIDNSGRIWIVEVGDNDITYTDTEIDSTVAIWDVSPDYKYAMTFRYTWDFGGELKIYDINSKREVLNVTEEMGLSASDGFFVGHKCIFVQARKVNGGQITTYNRLYKWR